jgi:enoyl-CoA hydratase/carnithine racemase
MVDAATAQQLGIVSTVVSADELLPTARALAQRIAANPPLAVRAIKQGLRLSAGRTADDLPELARFVGNNLSTLFTTADHHEAVQAFVERRDGHFTGR